MRGTTTRQRAPSASPPGRHDRITTEEVAQQLGDTMSGGDDSACRHDDCPPSAPIVDRSKTSQRITVQKLGDDESKG